MMTPTLDADQWHALLTRLGVRQSTAHAWADVLADGIGPNTFSDPRDLPNFIAQCAHESGLFERLEEDLYYRPEGLCRVWPRRFPTLSSAEPYARNPKALANKVYGGRMGNVGPNDGWLYRGRGLIQITGANNYRDMSAAISLPLLAQPELLTLPGVALDASIVWWESSVPDDDLDDVASVTRAVNGGDTGLRKREDLTDLVREALNDIAEAA